MDRVSKEYAFNLLEKGLKDIGFKNVDKEEDYVIYSIDTSNTDEERKYLVFDVNLATTLENRYVNIRAYYSINQEKYIFPKLYHKYLLRFINLANGKIMVGGFYFDIFKFSVYFEINQVFPVGLSDLQKLCARFTDEVVIIMSSYGKAIYALKTYLKSIKGFLKEQKKYKTLNLELRREIEVNIKGFLKNAKERYNYLNKKELSFGRIVQCRPKNLQEQQKISKILQSDNQLKSLMLFSKYLVPESPAEKLKIPNYYLSESKYLYFKEESKEEKKNLENPNSNLKPNNYSTTKSEQLVRKLEDYKTASTGSNIENNVVLKHENVEEEYHKILSGKYSSLIETLKKKPEMIEILQGMLLKLLDVGYKLGSRGIFDSFITSHDEFIHLNLDKDHQLAELLEEVKGEELKIIKSAYLTDIHDFILRELIPLEYFDFSVMKTDYSSLLKSIKN